MPVGGRIWPLPAQGSPSRHQRQPCPSADHRHTRAAFGRPVNPHGFRDALATTVAIDAPELIGIVTPLLGHSAPGTAQRHYNLARAMEAATAWHNTLASIGKVKP